ncbi:tubulin-specific chaperone C [Prorops nasuta]|uniref:tubulin-specific chaperone C n=1 Tax=Prorops nasuta TaxID=863751 RepID=UPI0034D004FF
MDSNTFIEDNLSERITRRDRERKNIIERRREERQSLTVESEQSSYFKDSFYTACAKIQDMLDNASSTPLSALPNIFDKISKEILTLKNYLSQSKIFLKVYDIRKAQETLQLLETNVTELEIKLLPKKKFGFKNRKIVKKSSEKSNDMIDGLKHLDISENIVNKQSNKWLNNYGDSTCTLIDKIDEQLILDSENVNKNDVLISDLIRCTVRIHGAPSSLHMINLQECTILVGPVTSSVFANNCNNCTFAFACQQFRLHSSTACTIYMHVTSRAIIEDCTKIQVAPYNFTYENQSKHFNLADIDPKINNWNCVDDFNWLSTEKKSPNWSILEPEFRQKNWD